MGVLGQFPSCGINSEKRLRQLAVCANSKEEMAAIEEAVLRLDRAARGVNLELTVYFLTATNGPAKPASQLVPPALEPVTKQLASVLAFKNFYIAETLIARTRTGNILNAHSSSGETPTTSYNFHIDSSRVLDGERGRVIQLENLQVSIGRPYFVTVDGKQSIQWAKGGIDRTDVEGREGQSIVVGKTSVHNSEAMIIVLIPRIVD
jgi:hypothetical protein